jgi:hypothetical protein
MSVEEKFNINLNQNLWGLVVAYLALGAAEHYQLRWLFWLSVVVSVGLSISVLFTFAFYTWNYCKNKLNPGSLSELRYWRALAREAVVFGLLTALVLIACSISSTCYGYLHPRDVLQQLSAVQRRHPEYLHPDLGTVIPPEVFKPTLGNAFLDPQFRTDLCVDFVGRLFLGFVIGLGFWALYRLARFAVKG